MRRTLIIGVLLTALLLVLGACGPAEAPPPVAPAPTLTPSVPAASTSEDIEWLATVITSEAGSVWDAGHWVRCTDEERAAVGWTVLNRLRSGTFGQTIKEVVTAVGQYAHNQEPTPEIKELAQKLLEGRIPDATGGATHFFSPISMPKEGESTTGFDIGGGLQKVLGTASKVYFPSWAKESLWVGDLDNVRLAYFLFFHTEAPVQTPAPTPAPTPTYLAKPLDNGVILGDFSISLSRVQRVTGKPRRLHALISKDDYATLYFTIRRVNVTADEGWLLAALDKIRIIDDHDNKYSDDGFGRLIWRDTIGGGSLSNVILPSSVPVGFTWVEAYDVVIPIAAPIRKIQILTSYPEEVKWEIDYPEYQPVSPDLDAELQEGIIWLGESVVQEKYLLWSIREISYAEEIQEWLIPLYVKNLDYTSRKLNLTIRFQLSDGRIRPAGPMELHTGGYFFNSQETNPYRPAYAIQAGFIYQEIPGLSEIWLTYYRFPVDPEEPENMPDKLLILNKGEMGEKKLYILKIAP